MLLLEARPSFDVAGDVDCCWAQTPNGHDAATPKNVNKSRRCMQRQSSVYRRLEGVLVKSDIPRATTKSAQQLPKSASQSCQAAI
jgi:hypothetical protein